MKKETSPRPRSYSEIAAEAAASVVNLQEPLKSIAFGKILDHLLAVDSAGGNTATRKEGTPAAKPVHATSEIQDFSRLVEAWRPEKRSDWALLSAYSLIKSGAGPDLTGQAINSILKNHGIKIAAVNKAINQNIQADPALMIQVKKSGSSRQGRKLYRVTTLGMRTVESKLAGEA